jgi:hypothetical protein
MNRKAPKFYMVGCDPDSTLDPVLVKIQELANLLPGWRFGKGIPPTPFAVIKVKDIYRVGSEFRLKADVFPGENGSLTLVFYSGDTCVELYVSPDGVVDLSVEQGEGFDFEELQDQSDASIADIRNNLLLLAQKTQQWNLSGSSTHGNLIKMSNAFGVRALPTPVMGVAYHSLTSFVPNSTRTRPQFVSTWNVSIPRWWVFLLSIG